MKSIYTGDISVIRKELVKLKEKLLNVKDIGSVYACLSNINGLNEIYGLIEKDEFLSFEDITRIHAIETERAIMFMNENEDMFCDNFIENRELYKYIGCYGHNTIVSEMSNTKNVVNVLEFTEKEALEIIRNYFYCCRKNDLEDFECLIKNKRLINISDFAQIQKNIKGQCHYIYDSLPLIFVESPYFTLETISYLIHEFAHTIDFKYLNSRHSITDIERSFFVSGKVEVISKFYEREALGFFEKEGIDNLCTASLLDNYYSTLEKVLLDVYFFGMLPDDFVEENKYYDYSKKKLLLSIENKQLRKDFKDSIDFEYLDLDCSIKYSIGGIGGIMLYEEFCKNRDLGNDMLNRFLKNRVKFADENFMLDLGFSIDKFKEIVEKDYQFIKKYKK